MRLIIKQKGKPERIVKHDGKKNCYDVLVEQKIAIPAACGGNGKCRKCKVQFLEGAPNPTEAEMRSFSTEELQRGYRLACCCEWAGDAVIIVDELREETMEILTTGKVVEAKKKDFDDKRGDFCIAVDIGTTTIAMTLFDCGDGTCFDNESCMNHGRTFGTDVLARITAANSGQGEQLQKLLQQDILLGIRKLISRNKLSFSQIKKIMVAGNTTMQHLLLGYNCKTLGQYPFEPVNLEPGEQDFATVFGEDWLKAKVIFLPGVSAFVGGDVVMGVYESGMSEQDEISMLLDLGTNGEMVLGNSQRMLAASAAAGPALEAGNIEKGMPGVAGAISHITIEKNRVRYETIGNRTPVGICGTGVLEVVAELLRTGKIDENGTLLEEQNKFTIVNGIYFSQNDIRQVQMAKAAIRAGIELLTSDYGIAVQDVKNVYLAGGFGYQLGEDTAIAIGMIPAEWKGRIRQLGNSSLKGAVRYGSSEDASEKIRKIRGLIREQNLANHPKFEEQYLKFMNFS